MHRDLVQRDLRDARSLQYRRLGVAMEVLSDVVCVPGKQVGAIAERSFFQRLRIVRREGGKRTGTHTRPVRFHLNAVGMSRPVVLPQNKAEREVMEWAIDSWRSCVRQTDAAFLKELQIKTFLLHVSSEDPDSGVIIKL